MRQASRMAFIRVPRFGGGVAANRRRFMNGFAHASTLVLSLAFPALAAAEGVALSGTVTSREEGPMEGVLVSAQREGSPITVTVVSDAKGHFLFPAGRLAPGPHAIRI